MNCRRDGCFVGVTAVNCRRDGSFVDVTAVNCRRDGCFVDVTAVNCRVWPLHATVKTRTESRIRSTVKSFTCQTVSV